MHMFGKKRAAKTVPYDPAKQIPVLKCSICNGEQVAGFKFEEVMLIRNAQDLNAFQDLYGVEELQKEY